MPTIILAPLDVGLNSSIQRREDPDPNSNSTLWFLNFECEIMPSNVIITLLCYKIGIRQISIKMTVRAEL